MTQYSKLIQQLMLFVGLFFILVFLLFVVNQLHLIQQLASEINPSFGKFILVVCSVLLIILFLIPFYIYFRLPAPLVHPLDEAGIPAFEKKLKTRWKNHPILMAEKLDLESAGGLDQARILLQNESNRIIQRNASAVFLTTAISQNGRLDGLTVLATQIRMVWQIAKLYNQRPSLREMSWLYGNVAITTLLAAELEDMDISEQVEPIINSVMGTSAGKSIPMFGNVTDVIMDSLLQGSINAFLTLRVGIICRQYCSSTKLPPRFSIRKNAFAEATLLLGNLVTRGSSKVVKGVLKALGRRGVNTMKRGFQNVEKGTRNIGSGISSFFRKISWGSEKTPKDENPEIS
ncbi:DUF697 domain-containing protein [Fulvivirgaceae bacterium LMO-SS25]